MFRIYNTLIQASSVATTNYFREFVSDGPIKLLACIFSGIASAFSTFFLPIWTTIFAVCILIAIDAVLGITVSHNIGEPFQSRKLWSTLKKFGWSAIAISCAHLIDAHIITSFDAKLVEFFAGMISMVELWSVVENLKTLDPTGPWKIFGKFIRTKGEKYLDITIDKNDLPQIKHLIKKIK